MYFDGAEGNNAYLHNDVYYYREYPGLGKLGLYFVTRVCVGIHYSIYTERTYIPRYIEKFHFNENDIMIY